MGLRQIITRYLTDEDGRAALERFAVAQPGDIARAILWLCREYESDDQSLGLSTGEHPAWTILLGGDLAWASYGYKRVQALRRLADLAVLFRSVGSSGLILIFDEVETIDQLWNVRSRMGAYTTLGELASMDHVWCIFAVTARFDAIIQRDLTGGILAQPGVTKEANGFLRSLYRDVDLVAPPIVDKKSASELATRILDLYRQTHALRVSDGAGLSNVVDSWCRDPRSNPRTLIRAVIDRLDRLRPIGPAS
jgi:hypothetical protein